MALIYNAKLVDLGPMGLLALTTGDTAYLPLPAHLHGYARWHDASGAVHDRFQICMRHVPRATLAAAAELQRVKFGSSVPSVRGRVEWVGKQLSDDFFVAPTDAASMGNGLVLLVFSGVVGPAMFRIVDVGADRVVYEEATASLCARLKMTPPPYARNAIEEPLVVACGSGHAFVSLAYTYLLLKFENGSLQTTAAANPKDAGRAVFSRHAFFHDQHNSDLYHLVPLESDGLSRSYQPKYKSKAYQPIAAAAGIDRFAIGHQGGTVELVDGNGVFTKAYRPNPRAPSNEQLALSLAYSGNFLGVAGWSGAQVVDIGSNLVATLDYPERAVDVDRMQFSPEVLYRPDVAVTDTGVVTLSQKALVCTRFSDLAWSPVMSPGRKPAKKKPAYAKVLTSFLNPALLIELGRGKKVGNSFMYGEPDLPAEMPWPEHAGLPMLLLCQIDLADAADHLTPNFLPPDGRLLFFVSVDEEGELQEDDEFNPASIRVLWLPRSTAAQADMSSTRPSLPVKPIRLLKDPSALPQHDSAIVQAQLFSDDELEEYRSYFEAQLPDGLSDSHRLGGYPHNLQSNTLEALAEYALTGSYPTNDLNGWTTAARWRLLLQLDSDEFMWGTDSGMLYFMIHDDDLQRRDFSRVVGMCAGL